MPTILFKELLCVLSKNILSGWGGTNDVMRNELIYLPNVNRRIERPSDIHDDIDRQDGDVTRVTINLHLNASGPKHQVVKACPGVLHEVEINLGQVVKPESVQVDSVEIGF